MRQRIRMSDATWTAFTEAIRFIVVPYVLVDLVAKNYPQLTTAFMPDIKTYVIFFGAMITAASTIESANKPGSYKRMLFGLTALAFICMWLFVLFGGGIADFNYGPYYVRFDMSKIVYIMLVGISLKGLLVVQTFSTHREGFAKEERRLAEVERARPASRARPAAHKKRTAPSFESMSRVAYEVTHDDNVGFSPPPQPRPSHRTLAHRTCPVCGTKASPSDKVCKACGAWITKESFR